MKQYNIAPISGKPDWSRAEKMPMQYSYVTDRPDVTAWGQLLYDSEALWVHLTLEAPEIRSEERGVLGMPCVDSCLEFFFSPMEGDRRYMNIESNLDGCLFLGLGTNIKDLTRLLVDDIHELFSFESTRTEKGFCITYAISYAFIRRYFPEFSIFPGKTMRANCYTCAELTEKQHFKSWSEVAGEPFTFHRTDSFGLLRFVEE